MVLGKLLDEADVAALSVVFEGFLARTRGSDACKPNILQKYRPANLQTYKYRRVGVSAKAAAVLASVLQPASGGIS